MRRIVIKKSYYEIPEDATPQVRWLLNLMNEYDLTMRSLAKEIHLSKQAVSFWVEGVTKISFGNICAIVYKIDKHADPEAIYKMIYKDSQKKQ